MAKAKGSGSKKSSAGSSAAEQPESTAAAPQFSEASVQHAIVTSEERYRLIAEAAYFRAEARGFQGGDPVADWLEAEAEINRWLPSSQRGYESEQRQGAQDFTRAQKPSVQGSNRPRPSS